MEALQQSITKTLAYLDIVNFAPTLTEIYNYLLASTQDHHTPPSLLELLRALERDDTIAQTHGFFYKKGREHLVGIRQEKYLTTMQKRHRARRLLRLLALMPHIEAIWLCNSVSWGNAHAHSDTDLFLLVRPGHLWTARFFTTALLKMLHRRPGETQRSRAICLSFYCTTETTAMEKWKYAQDDIHFTFWTRQMYPLYDAHAKNPNTGWYRTYQQKNTWVQRSFPTMHWTQSTQPWWISQTRIEKNIKAFLAAIPCETVLKKMQLHIMPQQLRTGNPNIVISDTVLKLHTHDNRANIQEQWQNRCTTMM